MKQGEEVIWHKIKIILKQLRKGKRGFRIISEDNIKECEARHTHGKEKSL